MKPEPIRLYDPTAETSALKRARLAPPEDLKGRRVALFDIGKTRSDEYLDYLEQELGAHGLATVRVAKPTNTKPAPSAVIQATVDQADVAVIALAD